MILTLPSTQTYFLTYNLLCNITCHQIQPIIKPNLLFLLTYNRPHKNNETNDKFYRKVAFLMYIRKWLILGLKAEKQLRNYSREVKEF